MFYINICKYKHIIFLLYYISIIFSLNNENKLNTDNIYTELIFLSPSLQIPIDLKKRLITNIMYRIFIIIYFYSKENPTLTVQ
jgi:hypothetical protein